MISLAQNKPKTQSDSGHLSKRKKQDKPSLPLRDRPFNLKRGGYGFLFRSEYFFRTTLELEYLFFLWHKAHNFFPEFNISQLII
jgi:hypothetical protein